MEQTYKQYLIHAGAVPVRAKNKWKPLAQVIWNEDGKERAKLWMEWHFERSFANYEAAEMEAQLFAKNWIDSQKNRED